jgi:hypothetical protein
MAGEGERPQAQKEPPQQPQKQAKKAKNLLPLLSPSMIKPAEVTPLPPVDENLRGMVKSFYRDYCEIQPKSRDLQPGEIWLRFWYWIVRIRRVPVKETSLTEFTRCFDKMFPHHIQNESKTRRYRGFKIRGLPFVPVYPSRGSTGQEDEDGDDSIVGSTNSG